MNEAMPWNMAEAAIALGTSGMTIRLNEGCRYEVIGIHPDSVSLASGGDGIALRVASYECLATDYRMLCGAPCGRVVKPVLDDPPNREYRLTIGAKQAAVIRHALELYSRLMHGQIDMVLHDAFIDRFCEGEFTHDNKERICRELKAMIFPELGWNASYGVGNRTYPESSIAWDVMQALRHRLAWDRVKDEGKDEPEHGYQVCYDQPMSFSGLKMATIEEVA